jgi:hypothetical protein
MSHIQKSSWPPGPWRDEPDREEWRANGFPCLIVRGPSGALCGYVGVPPGHPWHGKDWGDLDGVHVHGGLTYSDRCQENGEICHVAKPGEPEDVWWLGFDCAHSGDQCPAMLVSPVGFYQSGEIYKSITYVRTEVESLSEQASSATSGSLLDH